MDEHDLEDLARRTAPARRVIARAMVAGAALLVVYGAWGWWHDERVFARTLPTECALTAKNVDWTMRGGGSRRLRTRPLWLDGTAHLKLTHTLEGRRFAATADAPRPERFQVGKSYPCRYDPLDPSRVTVATSFEPDTDSFFLGGARMDGRVLRQARSPALSVGYFVIPTCSSIQATSKARSLSAS